MHLRRLVVDTTRRQKDHGTSDGPPPLAQSAFPQPPLVLTHPMGVGGFVWSSIIGPLSQHRRTYALDTTGDVGKSGLADATQYPKKGREYSA
jgi:hypothetical protein